VHLNRLIKKYDLNVLYISGPGHGAPATLSNSYLEGVYSEVYPDRSQDEAGMQKFLNHSRFPAVLAAIAHLKRPARFTRVANLAIACRTRSAPLSTTLICWPWRWLVMAKRKPGRSLLHGTRTSF
jgi:XFP N-terminal domain